MKITWNITQLERQTDTGGVVVAHWRVTAEETVSDDTFTASAYGTVGFTPDPNVTNFVPYEQLTEADVLKWVWGSVGKNEVEANLAKQIEDQKAPKTQPGLPWA